MLEKLKYIGRRSLDFAWVAVILLLPLTSLPLLSHLAGNSMVAPASFIPLLWIILFWFILYLLKRGSLPRQTIPFLFFITEEDTGAILFAGKVENPLLTN